MPPMDGIMNEQIPEISEEETFKAELLNAVGDRENKLPSIGESSKMIIPGTGAEDNKDQIAKQSKK